MLFIIIEEYIGFTYDYFKKSNPILVTWIVKIKNYLCEKPFYKILFLSPTEYIRCLKYSFSQNYSC